MTLNSEEWPRSKLQTVWISVKPRQVPIFLCWRVENVQFWINSIGHLGWLSCILNFPRFHKNVNSLDLWKYISENSSPKGSFWRNKRKFKFSSLSADSRYLLAVALKKRLSLKMLRIALKSKRTIEKTTRHWRQLFLLQKYQNFGKNVYWHFSPFKNFVNSNVLN